MTAVRIEACFGFAGLVQKGAGEAVDVIHRPVEPLGLRAFVPIWRRPWMTIGGATYGSSLLAELGVDFDYVYWPPRHAETADQPGKLDFWHFGQAPRVACDDVPVKMMGKCPWKAQSSGV